MLVLKIVMLFAVFGTISTIGVKISNRYTERANNLKQIKKALNIFETKIMYTYEPKIAKRSSCRKTERAP